MEKVAKCYFIGDIVGTKNFTKGKIVQIDILESDIVFDNKKVKRGEILYKVINTCFPQSRIIKGGWFISSEIISN
jgi:hypothetical protein